MLKLKNVGFKNILKDINISVDNSQILAIIGKNGAGKSTLLKCIGGFNKHRGEILLEDINLSSLPLQKRVKLVNYLPQHINTNFPCTVFEFLKFSTAPIKSTHNEIEKSIHEILEYFGILQLRNTLIQNISGGELAKVMLARIALIDPHVYMLDEPGAFLDIGILKELAKFLKDLKKRGKIILIISHDINFLIEVGDRFLGIKNGRVVLNGTLEELLIKLPDVFDTSVEIIRSEKGYLIKPDYGHTRR